MITKKTNLLIALPIAAVLALGGCGGDGGTDNNSITNTGIGGDTGGDSGSSSTVTTTGDGSITACFTTNNTVSYAMTTSFNPPSGSIFLTKLTLGPTTYNGQAVTGQTYFYSNGTQQTAYWSATNSGVTRIANMNFDGTITADDLFIPQNIKSGQVATDSDNNNTFFTFVDFETLTLAGKTFYNTCHFKISIPQIDDQNDSWYAPGYGLIKRTVNIGADIVTFQYDGTL